MTTQVIPDHVPTPLPVPAEKPKGLLERAQAMFPRFTPGKTAEVDPHLRDVRDYARYAISYWEDQLTIANAMMQSQMGDAEHATVNGVPVFTRMQYPVKAHVVEAYENDFLRAASR
jgi:hypothetical protein